MLEIVEIPLMNEYGTGYGKKILLFCDHIEEAQKWIEENLFEDGNPFTRNDVWDQTSWQIISYYNDSGSINREHESWWQLLELFAKKEVGPSVLKRIARMSQWWPPEK